MQFGIKELALTRLSDSASTCTICDIFCNFVVTKFCGLDVSLCFNAFDSNVGVTPSVSKNCTSDYTCQKYSENNSNHTFICNKK